MLGFGEKVKQLREEKGMTQQALAEQLHVTRQAVSRWECGARLPDLHTAKKIAELLEVSIDELMTGVIIVEEIATTVLLLYHAYVVHKERRVVCKAEEDISV